MMSFDISSDEFIYFEMQKMVYIWHTQTSTNSCLETLHV